MSKEETVARLRNIAVNAATAALLTSLGSYSARKLKNGLDHREYMDEETAEALRYTLDVFEGRASVDDPDYIERNIEAFSERMELLTAYIVEAMTIDEVVGLYYNERLARDIDSPVSAHQILNAMMAYITGEDDQHEDDEDEDDSEFIDEDNEGRIQDILPILPMPWNKQRFYDYVRDELQLEFEYMDEEQIDEAIQRLKESFTGRIESDYGVIFPEIAEEIDRLQQLKPLKLSDQEITDAAKRLEALVNELREKMYIYSLASEGLTVIKNMDKVGIELHPNLVEAADLVDKLLQLTPGTVNAEDIDQLGERINSAISEAMADSSADESYDEEELKDLVVNIEDIEEDITSELSDIILQPVKYAASMNWERLWSEEPADEEYAEAKIHEFIDFMDKAMADMPSMYRRARMKAVMQALPVGFADLAEVTDYLHSALEFMPSDGVLRFIEARFYNMVKSLQDDEQDDDEDDEE